MKSNTKGIITVVAVAATVFVAYKLIIKKQPLFGSLPSFEVMREALWQQFVKSNPSVSSLKKTYFETESWKNGEFITEWYKSFKNGKDVFTYNKKTYSTSTGLGV